MVYINLCLHVSFPRNKKTREFYIYFIDKNIIQNIKQGLLGPLIQLIDKLWSCSKYALLCEKSFCFLFTGLNQLEL